MIGFESKDASAARIQALIRGKHERNTVEAMHAATVAAESKADGAALALTRMASLGDESMDASVRGALADEALASLQNAQSLAEKAAAERRHLREAERSREEREQREREQERERKRQQAAPRQP